MNVSDENLRQAQLVMLDLLRTFRRICQAEGIRYYLLGGTVLGAVRHEGFIPWDDDVDVALLREDYDRFIDLAQKYLSGDEEMRHFSLREENSDYTMKLVNRRVFYDMQMENTVVRKNIWLDIFPIDGTPNSPFLRRLHYLRLDWLRMLLAFHYIGNVRIDSKRSLPKRLLVRFAQIVPVGRLIDPVRVKHRLDREFRRYPVDKSALIGNYMGAYHAREIFPKEIFAEGREVCFEGETFIAPKDVEKYLSQQYGDYMQLPPIGERAPKHHLIRIEYI